MRTTNYSVFTTLIFAFMFLMPTESAMAETIWEAKQTCKSDFGFYSGCETFSKKIPLGGNGSLGIQLPATRRLFFSLSCSRYTGRAPLVTLKGQSLDVNLGFAKSSNLQVLAVADSSESSVDFSISFDRISQFAPDCKVQYFGEIISPNIQFIESSFDAMVSDIDDRLEIKRSLLEGSESQPDQERLKKIAEDLDSSIKRQTMSCIRLLQQTNRRTITPASNRGEGDKSIIELALGPEFSNFEGTLDVKAICDARKLEIGNRSISGLVARFVNEAIATDELKTRLGEIAPTCTAGSCSGDIAGLIDSGTNNRLKKLKEFIDVVELYAGELKTQIADVNLAITDSALSSWPELRMEMMSNQALLQTIVLEGRNR